MNTGVSTGLHMLDSTLILPNAIITRSILSTKTGQDLSGFSLPTQVILNLVTGVIWLQCHSFILLSYQLR